MKSGKIAVLIGTRPGIIKMSPLVHELRGRGSEHIVIHSGQHYSEEMDRRIMQDAGLSQPDYHLTREESWTTHAQQTAYMLVNIEAVLMAQKPDVLLVCGDANTNMAGALAARKVHVKVGHVEAGLRSFDWRMPEEHNRIIIDHISEYLFAPTAQAKSHLANDGVKGSVFVVGNTIMDATLRHVDGAKRRYQDRIKSLSNGGEYAMLTLHREENVDRRETLTGIISAIIEISRRYDTRFVFPVHPRTNKRLAEFGLIERLASEDHISLICPLGYLEFLAVMACSSFVMTDSGGVQEESCIVGVPCATLRDSTERPETIAVGSNRVLGTDQDGILRAFEESHDRLMNRSRWEIPYGDGQASRRIIETCLDGAPSDEFSTNVVPLGQQVDENMGETRKPS